MNIYTNGKELLKEILAHMKKTNGEVEIATYGLYAGVTHERDWGKIYSSLQRDILNHVKENKIPHKIIVGEFYKSYCKPNCPDCKKKFDDSALRLNKTKSTLDLNMRFDDQMHMKYYRVGDRVWSGGINFGTSEWTDVAFEIIDPKAKIKLQEIFQKKWKKCRERSI